MAFPLPQSEITRTETKLGARFPLDYLARLKQENGGDLEIRGETWFLFPFLDTTDRKRLARTCNDVVRETMLAREDATFPANGVAIANDGGGNLMVLLSANEEPDRLDDAVYLWHHETGELQHLGWPF